MGKYLKSVGKNSLDFLKYVDPGLLVRWDFIDPGKLGIQYSCRFGYGYSLLWMVTLSTVMLIILQHNAAHLGIVTGLCISEAASRYMNKTVKNIVLWTAVAAAVATAMAEILGGAIALEMLFHIPVRVGSMVILLAVLVCQFTNAYKKKLKTDLLLFVSLDLFFFSG